IVKKGCWQVATFLTAKSYISRLPNTSDVKKSVNKLIEEHSNREITPDTNYNTSGIYMIYIDNFTSDKMVPIYIGQSKDVQKRYKVHLSEIL
ncbi:hypothetical protein, partial [Bacillus sp. REN3]|uniref:hypothetical protein n=1 Tax=Bacillus sp. REN3 TaxID=2802440 RepID=UPI001AED6A3F